MLWRMHWVPACWCCSSSWRLWSSRWRWLLCSTTLLRMYFGLLFKLSGQLSRIQWRLYHFKYYNQKLFNLFISGIINRIICWSKVSQLPALAGRIHLVDHPAWITHAQNAKSSYTLQLGQCIPECACNVGVPIPIEFRWPVRLLGVDFAVASNDRLVRIVYL